MRKIANFVKNDQGNWQKEQDKFVGVEEHLITGFRSSKSWVVVRLLLSAFQKPEKLIVL